jgi:hypothetical protein
MGRVWRAGSRHDPFNIAWANLTRVSCGVWAVALVRSAGPARHNYFFILQNIIYTYVQFIFNIINT